MVRLVGLRLALAMAVSFENAAAAEIWLSGLDPVMRAEVGTGTTSDYMQLFRVDAHWTRAATNVRVFKLYGQFLDRGIDSDLEQVFSDLQRRHIALALEIGILPPHGQCGVHLEGYIGRSLLEKILTRLRRLGGELHYLAMDEPLSGASACHLDIATIAKDVARNVSVIRRYFPDVQIGDIEGVGRSDPTDWLERINQWVSAYREAVGEPLAFFHADISWSGPWRQQLVPLVARLHTSGIKVGIIYDGDPEDQTDLAWTRHAEQRFAFIEANPATIPDQAILQTWMRYPERMLPENQVGTMTWLVNRYLTAEPRLVLRHTGLRLQGQLTDTSGQPLSDAPIILSAELTGEGDGAVLHVRSGQVPPKAASAILALRINVECTCLGPADVAIGTARYHDDRTGQAVQEAFQPQTASGVPTELARFRVRSGETIIQNTSRFSVTPGDPYTIQVPMRTDLSSAGSGYVALIFIDSQGKEVERLRLPFEPVDRIVYTLTTDTQGFFSLLPDSETLRSSVGFSAEFPGDSQHRTTSTTLR